MSASSSEAVARAVVPDLPVWWISPLRIQQVPTIVRRIPPVEMTRPFALHRTSLDAPCLPVARIMFQCQPATTKRELSGEEEDALAATKLDRLADELRALGIVF